ncbi:hypothetical protein DCAR_0312346 [Daucus carota subsp. sativus]|uniref:Uncharacterized protein n=1 Tax=Daucus carota subsp. sativus TaxID=79200 RepID=A0AAF0WNE1_DAUCS|nr:hypothetical protein DCAR_0312346 [Daucus carota subsp. sativus]
MSGQFSIIELLIVIEHLVINVFIEIILVTILHILIISFVEDFTYDETPSIQISRERTSTIEEFMQFHHRIRDKNAHIQLQNDLVEHLWQKFGG